MAMTLADLGSVGNIGQYRAYVIACGEMGKTPLSYEQWVKAGKPAG